MVAVTAFAPHTREVSVPAPAPASVHLVGRGDGPIAAALRRLPPPPPDAPRLVVVELGERHRAGDNGSLLRAVATARALDARVALVHAGAGGGSLLATAAKEIAGLETAVIAIAAGPVPGAVVTGALALATSGPDGLDVTLDHRGRAWTHRWERHPLPAGGPPHRRGAVVVTGGLGGLGLRVAHLLARGLGAHPVLIDRRAPQDLDDAGQRLLAELLAQPEGVTVCTADVTASRSLAAALAPLRPAITGLVHCSGTLAAGAVATLTSADLARAQAPKVDGLHHVLAALDLDRLDLVVTFGSIMAVAPHGGLGAYALANELLARETVRYGRLLPHCTTVAAQWSLWAGAGMAHDLGAVEQARRGGMWPVPLGAGLATVLRLLCLPAGVHSLVLAGGCSPRPDGTQGPPPRRGRARRTANVQRGAPTPFAGTPFAARDERPLTMRSSR